MGCTPLGSPEGGEIVEKVHVVEVVRTRAFLLVELGPGLRERILREERSHAHDLGMCDQCLGHRRQDIFLKQQPPVSPLKPAAWTQARIGVTDCLDVLRGRDPDPIGHVAVAVRM